MLTKFIVRQLSDRIAASGFDWFDVSELQPDPYPTARYLITTYSSPFGLRRLVWRFARTPPGLVTEDIAEIGVRFAKIVSGLPDDGWLTADHTLVEGAAATLWTALKGFHRPNTTLDSYRWYLDGSLHPPPQPAFRTVTVGVAGSATSGVVQLPPQVAMSVTFKTSERKHWGRIYWPAPVTGTTTDSGTIVTSSADSLAAAWVAFFNTCRAGGIYPVVYDRLTGGALSVDTIQVDDLFDVIRRRRWKQPSYRKVTALT